MTQTLPASLLCLALVGCWSPRDTGSTTIVGVIRSADGTPVEGIEVVSTEAESTTDEMGRFGVSWKDPTRFITFSWASMRWKRTRRPEDDGTTVDLTLPPRTDRVLYCDVPLPCEATLEWTVGPAFTAALTAPCEPGERILRAMPEGMPDRITCRDDPASPDRAIEARPWQGPDPRGELLEGIALYPGPVELTVEVQDRGRARDCSVLLEGTPAERMGPRRFVGRVWGDVAGWALCDGIPGRPTRWRVLKDSTVTLPWQPETPVLDLSAHHPEAQRVTLAWPAAPGHGWVMHLDRLEGARWRLPPLPPGRLQLGFDAPDTEVLYRDFRPDMPPGILFVEGADIGARREDGSRYGLIDLDTPIDEGVLPIADAIEEEAIRQRRAAQTDAP